MNKNTFKLDKNNEHYKSLIALFEKDQVFLQSELTLDILSSKLGISKSYLSSLINQTTDQNFYHFVNSYRADYLIKLFKSNKNKNFTILSLAYESGFNSKSTFQSFFKKYTGKTPSQYIKDLNPIKASI
ncbi:transcriptional regulator [Nonlabens ulvanivorans]|nr:AraC family transcriptional regulator [Nonlabens ulvanivorans]GAK91092.1 transcriptional regulator [Nonlabens ulvanivorans]